MLANKALQGRNIAIVSCDTPARIAAVRELFREYAASLTFDLCFQGFEQELAGLPGEYSPPLGRLLLAIVDDQPAGCVALHRLRIETAELEVSSLDCCEMKRLFVRPQFRGYGLGRELVEAVLEAAAAIGYCRMRLDTVPSEMGTAVELYRGLGFREIAPYRRNPIAGAKYLEIDIKIGRAARQMWTK